MVLLYNRQEDKIVEEVDFKEGLVDFLYQSRLGKWLLPQIIRPFFSKIYSLRDYSPWSQAKIKKFIQDYRMDMTLYEETNYQTFNDFFSRKYKKEVVRQVRESEIISVAEAKLQVFPISDTMEILIKNQTYHFSDLIENSNWSDYFQGGWLLVYRLSMPDYHRYLHSESGQIVHQQTIQGKLHTIREIAQDKYKVYKENQREYCIIKTMEANFILQMEVGALTAGKIHNHPTTSSVKGQEKGYFSLGGSTIIVAYPKHMIKLDQDILDYSQKNIECIVRLGERIGVKNVSKN